MSDSKPSVNVLLVGVNSRRQSWSVNDGQEKNKYA